VAQSAVFDVDAVTELIFCPLNDVVVDMQHSALVPNLGDNYPNLVMGHFDLGNGLLFSYCTRNERLARETQADRCIA